MPAKEFKLLVFLFMRSDLGGMSRPGYRAMRQAMAGCDKSKGSNATVRSSLKALEKSGWVFAMKRSNANMAIWVQVPARFRGDKAKPKLISVVQ
jgi:hypothetical protein